MHILITGAAGFIGAALALRLAERGDRITGLDNLNSYYDVKLKEARLARLELSEALLRAPAPARRPGAAMAQSGAANVSGRFRGRNLVRLA